MKRSKQEQRRGQTNISEKERLFKKELLSTGAFVLLDVL
jgi:hypothetical protein